MQACRVELPIGNSKLILETGKLAKQAHGAVVVAFGDTVTLTAACEGKEDSERDFFPSSSIIAKKSMPPASSRAASSSAEGRPTTKEILTSRLIDRPIRPLFPAGYLREVQVMGSTMSYDRENDPDILCMIGARPPCMCRTFRSSSRPARCASAGSAMNSSSCRPRRRWKRATST